MQNTKKIKYNLILGIASQALTIILGIIIPRLVLTNYGSEVNGLINSVTQIYSYIALIEAGVGTATVQALYRTIGKQDRDGTNAILAATNHYYHKTGILYLLCILIFSVLYPLIINTQIPTVTIVLIIIFNGLGNVINYFFQGKYTLLLQAEGKNYVRTSLDMFTQVFKNVAKIILISLGFDVIFVQAIAMAISLIQMSYITWYIRKNYHWINLKVEPDYQSISQSKNVLIHQISYLIFHNTDSIVLTVFCGLKTVSIYSMYSMLFSMVQNVLTTLSGSVTFVLGQAFHTNREKLLKLYDVYELYYMTCLFAVYSVANFFVLSFMKCYTAGVTDINYIDPYLPLLFIATYLLVGGRSSCTQIINIAGHFKQTQNRSIWESIINLTVSLIAVQYFGIYGVLFGTIAALLYRTNDMIFYANHRILHRSVWHTYKRWIINISVFTMILFLNRYINLNLSSYKSIILYCIPYTVAVFIVFFGVVSFSELETSKFAITLIKRRFSNKRKISQ